MKTEFPSAMKFAGDSNGYAPAVLVTDCGKHFQAFVYTTGKRIYTEAQALKTAQHVIEVGTKGYLNSNWRSYSNSTATLDWLKDEDFTIDKRKFRTA